jgi:hypothetical protein
MKTNFQILPHSFEAQVRNATKQLHNCVSQSYENIKPGGLNGLGHSIHQSPLHYDHFISERKMF